MTQTKSRGNAILKVLFFTFFLICGSSHNVLAADMNKDPFSEEAGTDQQSRDSFIQTTRLRKQPTYKAPLKHSKRIFQDSAKQKIFIPDKPLYFRVSLSSKNDAESYLISKKEETLKMDLSPLVKMDARILISLGTDLKEKYVIYKDTSSPEIILNIEALPEAQTDLDKFGSCVVALDAKDKDSGVDKIFISFNGQAFEPYLKSVLYNPMKIYSIRTYAVDRVGNASKPLELVFHIDSILAKQRRTLRIKQKILETKTVEPKKAAFQVVEKLSSMAPQIVFEKSEPQISNSKGNLLAPDSPLVLSRFNKIPAIKDVFIKFASNPKSVLKPFQGTPLDLAMQERKEKEEEGSIEKGEKNEVDIEKIDTKQLLSKYADQEPPFVMVEVLKDRYAGDKYVYISKRSQVRLIAEDASMGVDKIWYGYSDKEKMEYQDPFQIQKTHGAHILRYSAIDKAGNESESNTFALFLDTQLPNTAHSFTDKPYVRGNEIFINGNTHISLKASDRDSGIQKIFYRLNEDDPKSFEDDIKFAKEGLYKLTYYAVDQVQNHEKTNQVKIFVDKTPPVIFWQCSNPPRREPADSTSPPKQLFYPANSVVFLAAADQKSGVKALTYQINNQKISSYKSPIVFKEKGKYLLLISSKDAVGNQSKEQVKFTIY